MLSGAKCVWYGGRMERSCMHRIWLEVVRAALRKGHKFKVEEGPETVCVQKGLERYIHF